MYTLTKNVHYHYLVHFNEMFAVTRGNSKYHGSNAVAQKDRDTQWKATDISLVSDILKYYQYHIH